MQREREVRHRGAAAQMRLRRLLHWAQLSMYVLKFTLNTVRAVIRFERRPKHKQISMLTYKHG